LDHALRERGVAGADDGGGVDFDDLDAVGFGVALGELLLTASSAVKAFGACGSVFSSMGSAP
jgi:hypothetical protein